MSKNKGKSVNDAVLDYMEKQNRPYSALDVFNNLHNEHGKTAVVKSLEYLASTNKLKEKVYGKQKVYYINQTNMESLDDDAIKQMDADITKMNTSLKELQVNIKSKESLLNSLNNSLTNEEIQKKIKDIDKEYKEMEIRLKDVKSKANNISLETKEVIVKENQVMLKEWRKRKRMTNDILDAILEGYPKGKKALLEEIGVETDEHAKVFLPC